MTGISFDRAADYYDATRGLSPQQSDAVADLLAGELTGRDRCLEIGVGTGRIALPLHHRGVAITGFDLAPAMLSRLVADAGGRRPFPLLVADATRAPFKAASYDAVVASHVFHLFPEWRTAADESMRLLRPGGVLLVDFGGGVEDPWRDLLLGTFRRHGIERVRPGVSSAEDLAAHLDGRATLRQLSPIHIPVRRSLSQDLVDCERQIMSWSWGYPPEQMRAACDDVREQAVRAGLDLDEEVEMPYTMQWWAYDVPLP